MKHHPALAQLNRTKKAQDRIADGITAFSGSMVFVYLHLIWFAVWLWLKLDINLLTMIVSLEAIFLATFVLISQNRASIKQNAIANHDHEVDVEALENTKQIKVLLEGLAREIREGKWEGK